jgi:hypothetical protein
MQRNMFRVGVGAFLLTAVLGLPGRAAAAPEEAAGGAARGLSPGALWDRFVEIFVDGTTPPPSGGGSGSGEGTNGGGAMDPNGGSTGDPKPKP